MRLLFIVSILLVATSAFGQDARRIKTEKIDGLICTNFSDWRVFTNASNFWTPTSEQVIEGEREIESYLKKDPKFHSNDLCASYLTTNDNMLASLWMVTNESSVTSLRCCRLIEVK